MYECTLFGVDFCVINANLQYVFVLTRTKVCFLHVIDDDDSKIVSRWLNKVGRQDKGISK